MVEKVQPTAISARKIGKSENRKHENMEMRKHGNMKTRQHEKIKRVNQVITGYYPYECCRKLKKMEAARMSGPPSPCCI